MMNPEAPSISIILPVFHESERINEVLAHLCAEELGCEAEVIAVDGDPAAGTINSITAQAVVKLGSEKGRARQMNSGAAIAKGDILLFLHADTVLPQNALPLVRSAMKDRRIVAGAFTLGIDSPRPLFRITERYVALRTRLTRVPFGDQAIFIRRDYFGAIGGYKEIPLMEDVELIKRIRKRNDRICIVPDKVRTSSRRFEKEGVIYCTVRNMALQIFYALGVAPERLARWYRTS